MVLGYGGMWAQATGRITKSFARMLVCALLAGNAGENYVLLGYVLLLFSLRGQASCANCALTTHHSLQNLMRHLLA